MRPVICMITDGSGASGRGTAALVDAVAAAARAGVDLIQIRERDLEARALTTLVRQCVQAARGTRARIVVNDRLDVALAAAAHGVHLRGDSLPAARARSVAPPGLLIGRSVHSVEEASRAGDAVDYLICGTVFATASKHGREPAGLGVLADVARATAIPVLAVGGVTADNASRVAQSGAAGVAAIGLFADHGTDSFVVTVERISRAFDRPRNGS